MTNYQPPPYDPNQPPPQGPQPGYYPQGPQPGYYPPYSQPGYVPPHATVNGQPYVIPPRAFPHAVHIIISLCTFGLWLPFYLLIWALHPRKSTLVYPDGRRVKR